MREEMRKGFVELPERIAKALRELNQKCFAEKAFL
jgi:aspartate carbamoyltransferase regulatory subunit